MRTYSERGNHKQLMKTGEFGEMSERQSSGITSSAKSQQSAT